MMRVSGAPLDGLKDSPELQTAVAFTIGRAIDQEIGRKDTTGGLRPTVAVFDEVWAMLADPVLGAQILNAFRTARKRYRSIIAASQGIEDFVGTAESPHTVGLAILQNTEAKFICAQLGELSRLRDVLHLSKPAVEAVKELRNVPGHFAESYLLVANQAESSTVIQLTATGRPRAIRLKPTSGRDLRKNIRPYAGRVGGWGSYSSRVAGAAR